MSCVCFGRSSAARRLAAAATLTTVVALLTPLAWDNPWWNGVAEASASLALLTVSLLALSLLKTRGRRGATAALKTANAG